jgi:hypothetical protein
MVLFSAWLSQQYISQSGTFAPMPGRPAVFARALRGSRIQHIAELEYAIDPTTRMDCKITENRSAIPPVHDHFTPKHLDNGILCRYFREYSGIQEHNGN